MYLSKNQTSFKNLQEAVDNPLQPTFLGSGPDRGQSPVDFPYIRPSVCTSPPLGHPTRPEAQPARPEAQPSMPEAQPARSEA